MAFTLPRNLRGRLRGVGQKGPSVESLRPPVYRNTAGRVCFEDETTTTSRSKLEGAPRTERIPERTGDTPTTRSHPATIITGTDVLAAHCPIVARLYAQGPRRIPTSWRVALIKPARERVSSLRRLPSGLLGPTTW